MLCQTCKERVATIHLTEINAGQRVETHLCQQCAQQQGLALTTQIPLNELLNTLLSSQKAEIAKEDSQEQTVSDSRSEHACPMCGMTLKRFSKEPLLGCPHDYAEFDTELTPLIKQSHNGNLQHCGKVPSKTDSDDKKQIERLNLQKQLDMAVKNEDYETAARLRDQLREL